jgi:hypothetical protein
LADVLSPIARMQCSSPFDSRQASQILMAIPRNSSRLLVYPLVPKYGAGSWDVHAPGLS